MPIQYEIDHDRRLVWATASGTFSRGDAFQYQTEVWSRSDVAGYDELVDMTDVGEIVDGSAPTIKELAQLAASMDGNAGPTRFAIVAPRDFEFAIGRMYAIYRELDARTTREVEVFRTPEEAMQWLGSPR